MKTLTVSNQQVKLLTKYLLIPLVCFINANYISSQVPASIDANYILNANKSDEFLGSSLNSSRWYVFQKADYPWGGDYCFNDGQVSISDGMLILEVIKKLSYDGQCYWDPTYYGPALYYSGGIQSVAEDYSYGYFEIEAKFPGGFINGQPNGKGFWPAFWTYHVEGSLPCRTVHDEIDIMDPGGLGYAEASTMHSVWNDEEDCSIVPRGSGSYENNEPLFTGFHTYGVEWLPDRIIFYFDGQPFGATYNHPKIEMDPQHVVIDLQMDYTTAVDPLAQFPDLMKIKYFRYYQINKQYCNYDANINSLALLSMFTFGVRNNITLSDISLSTNHNLTFRASNSIVITSNFSAPFGSQLNLINTSCQ